MKYEAIVIGCSFGGLHALETIFKDLNADLPLPIIVVQHLGPESDSFLAEHLDKISAIKVKEAEDKEALNPGTVYIAPSNYHLLVETDRTLALSVEEKVNFSRPAIDVLFDSAADVFNRKLIAIILTGANNDGSLGLKKIKKKKGLAIVQDPQGAEAKMMPAAAINTCSVDQIIPLTDIATFINNLF